MANKTPMELITVQDLMVPLDEYATVDENASLFDAVQVLEKAKEKVEMNTRAYMHRAILVLDKNRKVVGKISQLDILRALEPKYEEFGDTRSLSKAGFSPEFIMSMMERYALCAKPFTEMCKIAATKQVRNFMYTPSAGEYVEADNSLCEAIHMLVVGQHQSLLVTRDKEIIGILRLTDVFMTVYQTMETSCRQ